MSDKSSLEQELLLYLQLRSADSCSPTLLNTLFPDGPEAWLLAFMICSNENNLSAVLSELPGNTACLSAGSDRFLYYFTSIQDESETVLAFLRKNDTYFQKASVSHCYELPVALRIITMEAECNFLDAFVYPNDTIFPCRAPNYPLIEQRVALFTNLVLSGQYQQIQKATTDMPTFFRQNNLGIRDAVLLWNRLGYRSEIHTNSVPYGHLELYELAGRFHSIDDMSYYMSQQLSVLLSAERSMASEQFYRMTEYIDSHFSEKLELGILCNQFFISPSYAIALFQKEKRMTFSQYITHKRLDCACSLMRIHPMLSIAAIGEMVGYKDYFYFAKVFQKVIGCTPSKYKEQILNESGQNPDIT